MSEIRIINRSHEGFRRGGVAHPADATYAADHFTAEQLKQIRAEPMLTVIGEPVPAPAQGAPTSPEDRAAAMLALVPSLAVGDFTTAGTLRVEAKRRVTAQLGFEPTEDELKAAGEAYARQAADQK